MDQTGACEIVSLSVSGARVCSSMSLINVAVLARFKISICFSICAKTSFLVGVEVLILLVGYNISIHFAVLNGCVFY